MVVKLGAGIARSIGRARIETRTVVHSQRLDNVSPDQLVGRGLKPRELTIRRDNAPVSPDQLVGRGLKQAAGIRIRRRVGGIARSIGRARIETGKNRARGAAICVSPDQLVGRGLKRETNMSKASA